MSKKIKRSRSKVIIVFVMSLMIFSACKKDIDTFIPQTVLENVDLGPEYMVLTVEGKKLIANYFKIEADPNGILKLNAAFQGDSIISESINIKFNIPNNGVGSYSLLGVPFELNYKGRTILGWDLNVAITEYSTNDLENISGNMTGTVNIEGSGTIPLILNFSAKRS